MDALEEFKIYSGHNNPNTYGDILNDKLNFKSNPLYDTALRSLVRHRDNDTMWPVSDSTNGAPYRSLLYVSIFLFYLFFNVFNISEF